MYQTPNCLRSDGVEGLQERLVEIGHGLALAEAGEEGVVLDAIQRRPRPVEQLDEPERPQSAGVGELVEQRAQHGGAQVPHRSLPLESVHAAGTLPVPEHPGGKDAVEERLDEAGAEEGGAACFVEADAQRLLEGGADGGEGGGVAGGLDAGQAVAGVGGEQHGEILGVGDGGAVGEGAGEVLTQANAGVAGEGARPDQAALEVLRAVGEADGLELGGATLGVLAEEDEVAEVGDEDEAVLRPIAADLVAFGGQPGVVGDGLDLDDAALGELALAGIAAAQLAGGVEAEVGVARALVGELADAVPLWA